MKKDLGSRIVNIIFFVIVLIIFYVLFQVVKLYSYNGFTKAEYNIGYTKFTRDKNVKYSYDYSYKLESEDYNDAIFYKTIEVKPNTSYKLTCMVKTENVESEDGKAGSGAQIAILDTTECSKSITGTNDWQELEFIFDSKDRETIEIGFRLGGNNANSKGTVWFSDFKLEEGTKDTTSEWNVACFIIKNIDLSIDNVDINVSMSSTEIETVKTDMERFKNSAEELSNNKMSVEYDIYEIDEPAKTITYSEEYGYYLSPFDVESLIEDYISSEEYDYIFVATKLEDSNNNYIDLTINDWVGLRRYGFLWNRVFKHKTSK